MQRNPPLLSIRRLCADHRNGRVLHDISVDIPPGKSLGLIGESGSGKSLTALACLGLLPEEISAVGSIRFQDIEIMQRDETGMREIRGRKIGIIFQDPMASLNPIMTLGAQILEVLKPVSGETSATRRRRTIELLAEVGLPDPSIMLGRHPFELSGGQQQRAMIAMTLAAEPALLIADEPTTALDVTTQAQILALLRDIQRRRQMSLLFISHDLDAVMAMSDRIAVMCKGQVVEQGTADQIFDHPRHAYTRALMAAHAHVGLSIQRHTTAQAPLALEVEGVSVDYGRWRPKRALSDVSLRLREGATLGIAGESGSGKSTLAQAIMGLIDTSAGSVRVFGMDPRNKRSRPAFAAVCQYVFQDTSSSLNPRRTLLQTLGEALLARGKQVDASQCGAMLEEVGMDASFLPRFPHQLSGGQRQRVVIARALAMQPRILVCDEPVSALDATVRNQILTLLAQLRAQRGLTLVFIGHDLGVMRSLVDEVAIMKAGRVVESGPVAQVFDHPRHAYTRELLAASELARHTPARVARDSAPKADLALI